MVERENSTTCELLSFHHLKISSGEPGAFWPGNLMLNVELLY